MSSGSIWRPNDDLNQSSHLPSRPEVVALVQLGWTPESRLRLLLFSFSFQVGYPTLGAFLDFSGEFESSPVRNLTRIRRDGDLKAPSSMVEVGKPFAPAMFDPTLHSFTPDQPLRGTGRNRYYQKDL